MRTRTNCAGSGLIQCKHRSDYEQIIFGKHILNNITVPIINKTVCAYQNNLHRLVCFSFFDKCLSFMDQVLAL